MHRGSVIPAVMALVLLAGGCLFSENGIEDDVNWTQSRLESIPEDAVKALPDEDHYPPILQVPGWADPVPMNPPITTAGAEDSPFMLPDGEIFLFFFTPDVRVPASAQVLDGVTGIWSSSRTEDGWSQPEKLVLSDDISLEGCAFAQNDTLWFCSVRSGNYREIDFYIADRVDGKWTNWRNAGEDLNVRCGIGELHLSSDSRQLYFGSNATGGYGGTDLWLCERTDGGWTDPVNLGPTVNSEGNEAMPFLTRDGSELWFTGTSRLGHPGPAVFRCLLEEDGSWGSPVEIVSRFAGEPCLDPEGNIYFVHHYFTPDGRMLEADIYVARRE